MVTEETSEKKMKVDEVLGGWGRNTVGVGQDLITGDWKWSKDTIYLYEMSKWNLFLTQSINGSTVF